MRPNDRQTCDNDAASFPGDDQQQLLSDRSMTEINNNLIKDRVGDCAKLYHPHPLLHTTRASTEYVIEPGSGPACLAITIIRVSVCSKLSMDRKKSIFCNRLSLFLVGFSPRKWKRVEYSATEWVI